MSELSEFTRYLDKRLRIQDSLSHPVTWVRISHAFADAVQDVQEALATPAPLPDLPPHVTADCGGHTVHLGHGRHGVDPREYWLPPSLTPADLDRIADACRILAARRRGYPGGNDPSIPK